MLTGQYRGIVIQNNDPNKEGRVKVFVPGINIQQLKGWNQKKEEDKFFKVMGKNTSTSLTKDVLENQKEKLFWAETNLPLFGMSSPGFYNASDDFYYIGNDSGYLFQNNNKQDQAFNQDKIDTQNRTPPQFTSYYIQPRTTITINYRNSGNRYCFSNNCSSPAQPTNSFWNKIKLNNECLNSIIKTLPKTYTDIPLSSLEPVKNNNVNNAIANITLNVTNPIITIDDVPVDDDNPLMNPCADNTFKNYYSTPISFETTDETISNSISDIPYTILVNDKNTLNRSFTLEYSDADKQIYTTKNIKVTVPISNIKNIKIKKNKNPFDLSLLLNILNIITQAINGIIMPRAPISNGQPMIVRGGGGGEIYNNISSNLIDEQQRRNSHIGGANNESKFSVNYGRDSLNDPNNIKGNNIQTNALQLHRGPMRAPDYNNDWKGMISIPGVGSHVWVIFENGNINYPIITGTFASKSNYGGIFETI